MTDQDQVAPGQAQAAQGLDQGAVEPELNRRQLAEVFGTSENTIDKWRMKGMPVATEGGNGVPYGYLYSECKAWLDQMRADEANARAAADEFVMQKRMEFLNLDKGAKQADLTPAQMRELAQAELVWMQASAKRRELVPVDEMVELLDEIFTEVRAGLDGLPDWMEREFALTPEQVERAVSYCDGVLREMHDRIQAERLGEQVMVIDEGERQLI